MMLMISRLSSAASILVGLLALQFGAARGQADAPPDSNYVKLLKKAPEARLGAIIGVIGSRGDAADLTYLLDRATTMPPGGFAVGPRRAALEALADAGSIRSLRPSHGLDRLNALLAADTEDPEVRRVATRLAGIWRLPSAIPALIHLAEASPGADHALRDGAVDALAIIATDPARAALVAFCQKTAAPDLQRVAIASLARLDLEAAARYAIGMVDLVHSDQNLVPIFAALLDRQGGTEKLLDAINTLRPSADGAKLALRAMGALGRSDSELVAALSKIAGIEADPRPPDPAEMTALIAAVASQGDPVRGERIFRRAEINCQKCHAIAGAAGGVGPDLSSLGLSSPVDYIVNSIMIPDQAIKEEYQTRTVLTDDGRILQGIVVEEDDRKLVLKDAQGERRTIATSAIEETKKGGSLMPKGLVATLTRAEFVDLVRFLSELGRPGAYAIRPTPTIQRWRALHPVPPGLVAAATMDPAKFRGAVLEADASHWVPAYAWTSGDLPIDEILAACEGPVGVVEGEITVSSPGSAQLRLNASAAPEVAAWVDDEPVKLSPAGEAMVALAVGTRKITVRVAGNNDHGPQGTIRVELLRSGDLPAEFSVVGGR